MPRKAIFQSLTVENADGTTDEHVFNDADVVSFTAIDGKVSNVTSLALSDSQKFIVKFKEAPLIKYKGKSRNHLDAARSRIDLEHKRFSKDILGLENASRKAKGKAAANLSKILKKKYKHVFNGAAVEVSGETLEAIKQLDYVEAVYPDSVVEVNLTESVPLIGATQAWSDLGITGAGVVVAIIDTGIDYTHPDLGGSAVFPSAKVIGGYDCYNNDADPMDDHFHGTHVAGIVAANGQMKGVAYEASLMAYKVLNAYGSGSFSTVIHGIELATDPDGDPTTDDGADVINMSLGGGGNPDDPVSQAVDNAVDSGVVVVVAAGNSYSYWKILSPGVARKAITVGATDKTDVIAYFSSKGPVVDHYTIKPDITAPGVSILAASLGGGNRSLNGTSMAAPHVAGVAALLLQSNPDLGPLDVKNILTGTALDVGYDVFTQGSGRVDVIKALTTSTVVSPSSISLGLDDSTQSIWTKTQTVEIWNFSPDTTANTYTISLQQPLAQGIEVTVPDTVTVEAATGLATFDFNIAVDNTVLAYGSTEPYSYEGILLISNGIDTQRLPFAFVKSPILTMTFDRVPIRVVIFDKVSKYWLIYPGSTTVSKTLPAGNYDVISSFDYYNTMVITENVNLSSQTTLNISSGSAVHDLKFSGIVDNAGLPLHPMSRNSWRLQHSSGFSIGVFTGVYDMKVSNLSAEYIFDWMVSDLMETRAFTHELGGVEKSGIYASKDFTNDPADYQAIEYTYQLGPGVDDTFIVHYLHHVYPGMMIGFSSYNIYDEPLLPDANGELKRMFYIKTYDTPDGSNKNYSNEWVYDYTGNGVFSSYNEKILYMTPLLCALPNEPLKGYMFPNFDTPVYESANPDRMDVGTGPHYFSTKLITSSSWFRPYPSLGQSRIFHVSQNGDYPLDTEAYYQLFDENGQLIKSGDTSGTTGTAMHYSHYLPYAGTYQLYVTYDGNYLIEGLAGNVTTTLDFNTAIADSDPPYITRFNILSGSTIVNSLTQGYDGRISFDLRDDTSAFVTAELFVKVYGSSDPWQQVALTANGGNFSAQAPAMAVTGHVSLKLVATDTAGNSLTMQLDPAYYYTTNSTIPVADAGSDQQLTAGAAGTALATLDGSYSYDSDGYIASYLWKRGETVLGNTAVITTELPVGSHDVTLTVTDDAGFTATDTVTIVVTAAAQPPVADAGKDQQLGTDSGSALVTLNGLGSIDPDGTLVSYVWKEGDSVLGNAAVIEIALAVGSHDITLTVTDNDGLIDTDLTNVVITMSAPTGEAIYVQDIAIQAGTKNGRMWTIIAEVTIVDNTGVVGDVLVTGNWSGVVDQQVSAVTYSKGKKRIGKAKFKLSRIRDVGTFTFTVTDVSKSSMIYNESLNAETSDSVTTP